MYDVAVVPATSAHMFIGAPTISIINFPSIRLFISGLVLGSFDCLCQDRPSSLPPSSAVVGSIFLFYTGTFYDIAITICLPTVISSCVLCSSPTSMQSLTSWAVTTPFERLVFETQRSTYTHSILKKQPQASRQQPMTHPEGLEQVKISLIIRYTNHCTSHNLNGLLYLLPTPSVRGYSQIVHYIESLYIQHSLLLYLQLNASQTANPPKKTPSETSSSTYTKV